MCSAKPSSLLAEDLTVAPSSINIIPSELLRDILSRLGLKANIHASLVCKTWFQVAVSVRKLQPRPWLFYQMNGEADGDYVLLDRLRSQACKVYFSDLKDHEFSCSKDGWLLVSKKKFPSCLVFLLNPFTREHIYLPKAEPTSCLAFTAAPTSSSCLVVSLNDRSICSYIEIATWRPGEILWTTHKFDNLLPGPEPCHRHRKRGNRLRPLLKCYFWGPLSYCCSV
ncbi:F-box/kelch-repeat protein [Raphanus sativus]|nr:F-box/kelch-repeat protein [Raphanus sativus]